MRKRSTNYKKGPAYVKKTTIAGPTITIDKYISGRIGTKDQHRVRIHPTEEKVMRWQNKRAERKVYGLLEENFRPDDLWCTFTYAPKTRKTAEEVRRDVDRFMRRVKRIYKKHEKELKSIKTGSIGTKGGIHLHMVLNKDFEGAESAVEKAWQDTVGTAACPFPRVNIRHLDRSHNWNQLAAYIVKNGVEGREREEPIFRHRYSTSRNLRKPKEKVEIVYAKWWTENTKPIKGYEIIKDSQRDTFGKEGYPYQTYTMIRTDVRRNYPLRI